MNQDREDRVLLLFGAYLVTVAITTGISGAYGPTASVIDSLPGIGFVIAIRNRLQGYWWPHKIHLLLLLIFLGALGSTAANLAHPQVALASFVAFLAANLIATVLYRPHDRRLVALAIVSFAIVDSLIFPAIAFGSFMVMVVLGQIAAKIIGGFFFDTALRTVLPDDTHS